nr:transmembrane protein, putative [Tanacetum cinerariifolium]
MTMTWHHLLTSLLILFTIIITITITVTSSSSISTNWLDDDDDDDVSSLFRQDYSPPAPPPPPPHPPSASCEADLGGVGSLDTICKVVSDVNLTRNIYVSGKGSFYVLSNVSIDCSGFAGCEFGVNVSGNFSLGEDARVKVGSFEEVDYGGGGGGKAMVVVKSNVEMNGGLFADGGDGGPRGGGGSGGSVYIKAYKMTGTGKISACGGNGFGGGGGGRIATDVFSRHEDPKIYVHGGNSLGCPSNAGAAGTFYDSVPRSLIVDNYNMTTDTDTLLMEFPYQPLLTSIFIRNSAKAAVYGALRMSVKMFLMWNSQLLIDGEGDRNVGTSVLEASNLIVLKESSTIHSNANLEVRGQGLLNLSGPGDCIEAQRLGLLLFYGVNVGPGSVLRGPLENATNDAV